MLRCCTPPVSPWAWKSIVLGSLHIFRSVLAKDSGWRDQSLTRCMTTKLKYQISLTLRLFTIVRFSRATATKGRVEKRRMERKKGKTFCKTLFSVPGKQAEGEGVGFSAPIIVTFGVTERIHWITDRQVSGTVISYFEWPVIRIVSERGITDRYRNRFDTERVHDVYVHVRTSKNRDRSVTSLNTNSFCHHDFTVGINHGRYV